MSAWLSARVRRALVRSLALAALLVAAVADPAAAHSVGNGSMPAPPWLLAYLGAFAVLATAVALRATWPRPRLATGAAGSTRPPTAGADAAATSATAGGAEGAWVGQAVGVGLLALVLVAAVVGPDDGAANIAPVAVLVVWWIGLPLASLLLGDVMRPLNPFVGVVRLVERARARPGDEPALAPTWVPAAFLFAFAWFFVAYHRPGSPRALAVFLALYSAAAVALGLRWGSRWLATGEGFGALSAAVSSVAPLRRSPAPPGTAALMVVWIGSTAFDAFASTPFWEDVVAGSRGWELTALSTVGFVWLTAVVAGLYLGALWAADRWRGEPPSGAAGRLRCGLGVALVPVALAWFVGHDLTFLLFEGQNFIALLSDPIGRGWDLLGTISQTVDYGLARAAWVPWVQVLAVAAGHVGAVVVAHDTALGLLRPRAAVTVTAALSAVVAASAAAAALLVLG